MHLACAVSLVAAVAALGAVAHASNIENGVCAKKGDSCGQYTDQVNSETDDSHYHIKAFTVSTQRSDGYRRFNRSAHVNGIPVETLDDIEYGPEAEFLYAGGGYKLNALKRALRRFDAKNDNLLVMYTESDDVIFTQSTQEIGHKFAQSGAGILIAAQTQIPAEQTSYEHLYPPVATGARYLNAGMFVGRLANVRALLGDRKIDNSDCMQLFVAQAFLDAKRRDELNMQLDHRSTVFQSLHGAMSTVSLEKQKNGHYILVATADDNSTTTPSVVQGNRGARMFLNNYGNYLAGSFVGGECVACREQLVELPATDAELPAVTLAVFITRATPFLAEFMQLVRALDYPQSKLDVFVWNAVPAYADQVRAFAAAGEWASFRTTDDSVPSLDEAMARNAAVSHALQLGNEFMFVIDADARLDNAQTLRELLRQNRTLIAPMLTRHGEGWSNFWGALNERGYYARSHDYIAIVDEDIRGIWNVPYVSSCYLARKSALPAMRYYDAHLEPDMALCQNLRNQGIFMHVSNQLPFGHLVNADGYNPDLTSPDLYTMLSNPLDWERQYIHADYADQLLPNRTYAEPCPDVFWFPIVTERFAAELIAVMEAYGQWSDGSSMDDRLKGGYEAVPTRDVHMNQVGLEELWARFLRHYVRPLQEAVYKGYHSRATALMNFVVRYKPTEQPFLKPHHDTSTYTINIALNRAGIDYVGGGCRFLRYDCAVTDTMVGHMLMHPGRLTHYHEGLYVTEGTRYIMVSFVDPE